MDNNVHTGLISYAVDLQINQLTNLYRDSTLALRFASLFFVRHALHLSDSKGVLLRLCNVGDFGGKIVSQSYVGQIMMTGFGFGQKNFAQCNGQLMAIAQNQALFSLLGTVYGGDGRTTFGLPDLRSRTPFGAVQSQDAAWQPPTTQLGQIAGQEQVQLLTTELPLHNHSVTVTTAPGGRPAPRGSGLTFGTTVPDTSLFYGAAASLVPMSGGPLGQAGGNQPHPNLQPYETINFNICLYGVFPSRN
ncbi:phage tail protein [Sphingomonas sp. M1-B02]|uniref:phage tail protein n=1 Tax=Sphingomonas sp. M1-B02 TaxID=3114300 RepID=UPI00224092D2|nr:tail fiber protein [Sphingomonas sp. S6-11]UZK66221.1 tail fiber protein [Sphingomonas sp. S6-11]